jgi:hypothetical protein
VREARHHDGSSVESTLRSLASNRWTARPRRFAAA